MASEQNERARLQGAYSPDVNSIGNKGKDYELFQLPQGKRTHLVSFLLRVLTVHKGVMFLHVCVCISPFLQPPHMLPLCPFAAPTGLSFVNLLRGGLCFCQLPGCAWLPMTLVWWGMGLAVVSSCPLAGVCGLALQFPSLMGPAVLGGSME